MTTFIETLILVAALSVDTLVASFAYGTNKIKIPPASILIINFICSGILVLFLSLGAFLNPFIPEKATTVICFLVLFLLGLIKLFDSYIKKCIKNTGCRDKKLQFHIADVQFILTIYAEPQAADQDQGGVLSPMEAVSLAIALSLDSAAAGFGAGVGTAAALPAFLLSFLFGITAVIAGCLAGNKIAERLHFDVSFISGLLLILLAFIKLF